MKNHLEILPKLEGRGGGCFTGSTFVLTKEGKKPISCIFANDIVIAFDDKGILHEAKVLDVQKHENQEVWQYTFWGGVVVHATPNHLVKPIQYLCGY